ncbi:MAG: hypothetical protein RIR62_477 [Pseudomonadota bacterium]
MTRLLPAAILSALLAAPAFAGGISIALPSLTFPDAATTLSTKGCAADARAEPCAPRN